MKVKKFFPCDDINYCIAGRLRTASSVSINENSPNPYLIEHKNLKINFLPYNNGTQKKTPLYESCMNSYANKSVIKILIFYTKTGTSNYQEIKIETKITYKKQLLWKISLTLKLCDINSIWKYLDITNKEKIIELNHQHEVYVKPSVVILLIPFFTNAKDYSPTHGVSQCRSIQYNREKPLIAAIKHMLEIYHFSNWHRTLPSIKHTLEIYHFSNWLRTLPSIKQMLETYYNLCWFNRLNNNKNIEFHETASFSENTKDSSSVGGKYDSVEKTQNVRLDDKTGGDPDNKVVVLISADTFNKCKPVENRQNSDSANVVDGQKADSANVVDGQKADSANVVDAQKADSAIVVNSKKADSAIVVNSLIADSANVVDTQNCDSNNVVDIRKADSANVADSRISDSANGKALPVQEYDLAKRKTLFSHELAAGVSNTSFSALAGKIVMEACALLPGDHKPTKEEIDVFPDKDLTCKDEIKFSSQLQFMKFNPDLHISWRRDIISYFMSPDESFTHMERSEPATPNDLLVFMCYETLRLCTFSFLSFPATLSTIVTHLAQNGFYYLNEKVACFECRSGFDSSRCPYLGNEDLEQFHDQQCRRHQFNKPLQQWLQGIDMKLLASFYFTQRSLLLFSCDNVQPPAESQDPRSCYILTSTGRYPVPYRVSVESSQSQHHVGASNQATDRGAVGGTEPKLDLREASYPQFSSTEARKETFTPWDPAHPHHPDVLVPAGFFYAGYADCTRCFYCGLGLKFWRTSDIPAYEHAKYRPTCAYIRMYKGQDYIDRVLQDIREQEARNVSEVGQTSRPSESTTSRGSPVDREAQYHNNSEVSTRNRSFVDEVQAANHIAGRHCNAPDNAAGMPVADNTEGIPSLQSALEEETTGSEEVVTSEELPQASPPGNQQPAAPSLDRQTVFLALERERTLLSERTTCRTCHTQPVSCVYLPCGHVIACQECADITTHCLLCAKQIIGTANIYLA